MLRVSFVLLAVRRIQMAFIEDNQKITEANLVKVLISARASGYTITAMAFQVALIGSK
jgi:hypothetical protein